jgi:hypothetical protein
MRAVTLLRGSPRRKAVAGVAAAITVLTSFFVVQGFAGATTTTAPPTHLLAVGPTDPTNDFPVWYKDSNNLNVGLCLDVDNPFCNIAADVPDPTQPVSFPDNFPEETFYQLANSSIALPNGTTAVLDDNLEAAFANGGPVPGDQIVFGRVRIRITTPTTGHYVVTHPYGVDEFDVTDTATRNINFVEDVGIGAPGDFTGALGSRINPFLRWDTGLVTGPDGASYLGDAATPHAITGSALGTNFFRIDGPNIGGTGINTIQTNLFTVQGRVSTNNGVAPTAVTYTRTTTTGGFIDAFANSDPNQVIQVSGTGVAGTTMKGDATTDPGVSGNYFARAAFTGASPPATVNITNTSDRPVTKKTVTVTDQVTLTKVTYDADTGNMKVSATSSDTAVPPTMTVVGFGATLVAGNATFNLGADKQPPAFITVTSSKGGTDTAPVNVTGAAFPSDPVVAQAPATLAVQQGQQVQLDGSASLNATGFSWAQVAGDPVTLTNANTAIATFTAPSTATTLTFRLTVQGPGGPQTTDTVVTVQAVAPPVANAGPAQTVLIGNTVTLDGSASTGATSFSWAQTGGVPAALSSTTAVKPTFKMPNTTSPLIYQLTVTGPGGTDVASVQINPQADVLTTTRVEYRTGTGEWRVEGTAQVVTGNQVTVHIGNSLAGTRLGSPVIPDALGAWSVRLVGPPPDGTRTVSIESSRGGILLGVPINVRN